MIDRDIEAFADFAGQLADASRAQLRATIGQAVHADPKGDGSPVTAVDRAVEAELREMIAARYPDHGIVGEEHGAAASDSELVWVLDPIDGTLPFLAGIPVFGTLIALVRDGVPVVGVVDMPMTGERWVGGEGMPTRRNGEAVSVRSCDDLSAALLSTSNPDFYDEAEFRVFARLKAAAQWTVYGGSCLAYAQIASGRIDIGVDTGFDPFDYCALVPVICGAGGVITDWRGDPLTLRSGKRIIAAGDSRAHARALEILSAA